MRVHHEYSAQPILYENLADIYVWPILFLSLRIFRVVFFNSNI